MQYNLYKVNFYGTHELFARNEKEARRKTLDWLEQHSCFVSFNIKQVYPDAAENNVTEEEKESKEE